MIHGPWLSDFTAGSKVQIKCSGVHKLWEMGAGRPPGFRQVVQGGVRGSEKVSHILSNTPHRDFRVELVSLGSAHSHSYMRGVYFSFFLH